MLMVVLLQMEYPFSDLHIIFGRKHIDGVSAHMHSVLRFHHRHRGIFSEYISQETPVIRGQMLYDSKSHSCIHREKCQKLLERLKSSR